MAFLSSTSTATRLARVGKRNLSTCGVRMSSGSGPVGFIGLGIMGLPMAQNIVTKTDRDLVVWNRSAERSKILADGYAGKIKVVNSPKEVVENCETTFVMLSTPEAVENVYFSMESNALDGVSSGKHLIDCSTLTEEASKKSADAVAEKGGLFLEAPVSGSKVPAENGQLIFLCGGNRGTFDLVEKELEAMGKKSFFLGGVGTGTRMKLVVNMVMGSMMTAFSEGIVLAEKSDLDASTLLDVLDLGAMANPLFRMKGAKMLKETKDYAPHFPLEHMQKDMRFASLLGDQLDVALPVAAAANELFKTGKGKGYARSDLSAVIEALRNGPEKEK